MDRACIATFSRFARFCWETERRRKIILFLVLNVAFTFVELFYGWLTHSLGLIGDGVHMFFDSSVIFANLVVMFITTLPKTPHFTFGYNRAEAMAGFVNSLLLVFSALSILVGALERFVHPHFEIHSENLLLVSTLGLLVNIVGLAAFGDQHCKVEGKKCCHEDHPEKSFIQKGMFLHVLADTLGSVAVIVSSLIIRYTGWYHADTICSVFLAILILIGVRSLMMETFYVLLNCTPSSKVATVEKISSELKRQFPQMRDVNVLCWEQSADAHFVCIQADARKAGDASSSEIRKWLQSFGFSHRRCLVDIQVASE